MREALQILMIAPKQGVNWFLIACPTSCGVRRSITCVKKDSKSSNSVHIIRSNINFSRPCIV